MYVVLGLALLYLCSYMKNVKKRHVFPLCSMYICDQVSFAVILSMIVCFSVSAFIMLLIAFVFFLLCFPCVGVTCFVCTLLQGGDKLTLALGGANSAAVGTTVTQEGAHSDDTSQDETDDNSKLSQKRCTTPVTVTHFSWSDHGKLERVILPSPSLDNRTTLNHSGAEDAVAKKSLTPPVLGLITTSNSHTTPSLSPKVMRPISQSPKSPQLSPLPVLNANNPFINPFTASKLSPTESKSLPPTNPFHGVLADKPNPFLSLCTAISNPFQECEGSKSHTTHDSPEDVSDKTSTVSPKSPVVPLSPVAQSSPVADKRTSATTTGETRQCKVSKVSSAGAILEIC